MNGAHDGLTLAGLAQILRDHMDGTAVKFDEMRAQFGEVGRRIDDLRGEIGTVAAVVRDLAQIVARHDDEIHEHRQQIRQIYARMEQHDARMEEMTRDIRRILDTIERRGGDAGRRRA